jgi:hypothetical protein
MQLRLTRPEVYKLIDGEREYQDKRWNSNTTTSQGWHSPQEWLTFIQDYTQEALHIGCREADQVAYNKQLAIIRKIAGMSVACMEQHGAPERAPLL